MAVTGRGSSPMVQRRRLRSELRQARQGAGLTQQQVASAMDWSLSKVIRIENGATGISTTDLQALLRLYQLTSPARIQDLTDLARSARERSWWSAYNDAAPAGFLRYVEQEASARAIRSYQHSLINGLLQTEEYAALVLHEFRDEHRHGRPELRDEQIESLLELRLKRQELLARADPPALTVVHDEAALRRQVGGPAVMRRQLKHLAGLAARRHITLEVIPFTAGVVFGMGEELTILNFPGSADDPVAFLEHGDVIREDRSEQVAYFEERFHRLRTASAGPAGSAALTSRIERSMR